MTINLNRLRIFFVLFLFCSTRHSIVIVAMTNATAITANTTPSNTSRSIREGADSFITPARYIMALHANTDKEGSLAPPDSCYAPFSSSKVK